MVFAQSRRLHYCQSRVAPVLEPEFDMEKPKFASKKSVSVSTDSSVPTPTMPESIEEELPRLQPCEPIGAPTFIEPSTEALQSTAAIPCDHPSPVNLFPETFSVPKPRFGPLDVRSASNNELSRMCRAPRSRERCSSSGGRLHWSFQAVKESYGGAPLAPDITIPDSIPQLALSPIFPTLRTSNQHQREQIAPVQVLAVPQTIQTFEATSHRVCRPRRPRR